MLRRFIYGRIPFGNLSTFRWNKSINKGPSRVIEMECPLCNLKKLTRWYYADKDFIICDCLTCNSPMIVYRKHKIQPSSKAKNEILRIARLLFKNEDLKFRGYSRSIPMEEHWHEHLIE